MASKESDWRCPLCITTTLCRPMYTTNAEIWLLKGDAKQWQPTINFCQWLSNVSTTRSSCRIRTSIESANFSWRQSWIGKMANLWIQNRFVRCTKSSQSCPIGPNLRLSFLLLAVRTNYPSLRPSSTCKNSCRFIHWEPLRLNLKSQ